VLGWESAREIPSAVEGTPKDPEEDSHHHTRQGVLSTTPTFEIRHPDGR
jgi:hypothetical protein